MGLIQKIKDFGSKIVEKIKSKFKKPNFDNPITQRMKTNPGPLVGEKNAIKKDMFKPLSGIAPYHKMTPEQRAEFDKMTPEQRAQAARAKVQAMKKAGLVSSSK